MRLVTAFAAGKPVLNAEYKLAPKCFCAADEAAAIVGRPLQPGAQRQALRTCA
ncbi:MAG TPA: hypothetical protein VK790_06200 [Solirubrobacteraceae bacterium]|nr:hypothetical protein [Solirubrobacteraceae bacterium]